MIKNYTVEEASKILGYSKNSIYGFLKSGEIKSVRIGKGKIKIPQSEIDRFAGGVNMRSENQTESNNEKKVELKSDEPLILPTPRQGKSLEELSGEAPIYTLKLWFEERVTIPRLFDWFIGLSSLILGISMFLHSKQVDVFAVGRFSMWFMPIRLSLILSGVGLVVADMIQEEFLRYRNLSNYFRGVLFATFLGFAWILLQGGDVDGFVIYGLFSMAILIEAVFSVRSSTAYMFYIQGLLISTALIFFIYPTDPSLSSISFGLFQIMDGFKWIWLLFVGLLVMFTLYGFFWEKKVLKLFSAFCGLLLAVLALYFANTNYWDRAFFVLIAGMIGMIEPVWEIFKTKFRADRPMVFRMFGIVLMFFSLVVVLISIVQSILLKEANQNLAQKADFGIITAKNTVDNSFSSLDGIAQNAVFQNALKSKDVQTMDSFTKAIFKNNSDLGVVAVLNNKGEVITSYPFSSSVTGKNYSNEIFFQNTSSGNRYFSRTAESLAGVSSDTVILGTPIIENGNVVIGSMVASIGLDSLGDRLDEIADSTLDQSITLVDGQGRWLSAPQTAMVGKKISETDTTNLLWSRTAGAEIGYNFSGKYSLFRSSKAKDLEWTVVVSEPVFSILDVSGTGLMVVLFLLGVAVFTVSFSFVFSRNRLNN